MPKVSQQRRDRKAELRTPCLVLFLPLNHNQEKKKKKKMPPDNPGAQRTVQEAYKKRLFLLSLDSNEIKSPLNTFQPPREMSLQGHCTLGQPVYQSNDKPLSWEITNLTVSGPSVSPTNTIKTLTALCSPFGPVTCHGISSKEIVAYRSLPRGESRDPKTKALVNPHTEYLGYSKQASECSNTKYTQVLKEHASHYIR